MGEVLGLGLTHYPGLMVPDEAMGSLMFRFNSSKCFAVFPCS
jgi:hypothetical protein